jgi:uncharacterized membrane protein YkoI
MSMRFDHMNKIFGILILSVLAFSLLLGCTQVPTAGENKTNITKPPVVPPAPSNVSAPPANQSPPANVTPPSQNGSQANETYDPKINPADFTNNITNRYFSLIPGKKMVYEADTEDGKEKIEVYVTNETRMVMGVKTVVVWDRVWLDGDLIEDTYDWYAQDKEGNVWYFGEDTKEYAAGQVVSTHGAWEAGVDGAKPGIVMKANPVVGESYRQEYYAGQAEDMARVLALNESVTVPYGSFGGCLKTLDWTPLEANVDEHKYYCPSVGGFALEVVLEDGERVELISVEYDSQPSPTKEEEPPAESEPPKQNLSEEEAIEIALAEVPGEVTDVAIEKKFGKWVYVIEIDADNGPETDVIIDRETGEILGVET